MRKRLFTWLLFQKRYHSDRRSFIAFAKPTAIEERRRFITNNREYH